MSADTIDATTEGVPAARTELGRTPLGSARSWWAGAFSLVALTVVVYWPTLQYGFVGWDDDRNVIMNPLVVESRGLPAIWTRVRGPAAGLPNYPLFYSSFWLEYRLWAGNPAGYHATNLGLHALNATLVLLLLRRLGLSPAAAWVCALLFAVHPMQVESVAWITERKNVLSATFYLLAFLLYVRHRRANGRAPYVLALLAFIAALLSKTASITLVLSLFLADCLVEPRTQRVTRETVFASLCRLAPFISAGIVASLLLLAVEDRPASTLSPPDRVLVAARALWFYFGKLLWPAELIPIYPRWSASPAALTSWLPVLGLVLAIIVLWRWRAAVPGQVSWGLGHFLATLLPVLGLVPFGYHIHSYVADRFVYLACVGVFVALVLGAERILLRLRAPSTRGIVLAAAGVVVAVPLAVLTRQQLPIWRNSEALWSTAVAKNPQSFVAQANYGGVLNFKGQRAEAVEHWQEALRLEPLSFPLHARIASAMRANGDLNGAVEYLRRTVEQHPNVPDLRADLADALAATGKLSDAVRMLTETIRSSPTCALAYDRLAWIYATAPSPEWRQGSEAVRLAERAVRLTARQQTQPLDTLAAAYAEAGQYPQAIEAAGRAIELAERDGDELLAGQIRNRLASYRQYKPYHTPKR